MIGLLKRAEIEKMVGDAHPSLNLKEFLIDRVRQGHIQIKNGSIVNVKNIALAIHA